jgi:hypothetical protein
VKGDKGVDREGKKEAGDRNDEYVPGKGPGEGTKSSLSESFWLSGSLPGSTYNKSVSLYHQTVLTKGTAMHHEINLQSLQNPIHNLGKTDHAQSFSTYYYIGGNTPPHYYSTTS